MPPASTLLVIKAIHTAVWAIFATCVVLLPLAAHAGRFGWAAGLAGAVFLEVLVLALNRWRCPLTGVAARHTSDRQDNFDIFLPLWLARYNKLIFGSLYVAGLAYTAIQWFRLSGEMT